MSPGEKGHVHLASSLVETIARPSQQWLLDWRSLDVFLLLQFLCPGNLSLVQLVQVEAQIHQVAEALRPRYKSP